MLLVDLFIFLHAKLFDPSLRKDYYVRKREGNLYKNVFSGVFYISTPGLGEIS